MDYKSVLSVVTPIAERAAQLAHSYFRQALLIEMKENETPVTIADKKAEELIRGELGRIFPHHGILGEEFGTENHLAEFVWTVDPIDGTRSFVRGIPLYGTLLGLLHHGNPVLGVMVMPELNETYTASQGNGAYCNGSPVKVSAARSLAHSMVACADTASFVAPGHTHICRALGERTEMLRTYTDCFAHSLVIRGAIDAMLDPIIAPWDVVPLAVLVREAGGSYFDFQGGNTLDRTFVSCAPQIQNELLSLINATE